MEGERTPLHLAVDNNDPDMIKILLDGEADVNAKMNGDWTPLHLAVSYDNNRITKLLLDMKADINAKMVNKKTPLHIAVENKYLGATKLLLDMEADTNATIVDDWTPLHLAVDNNDPDIIKLLLDRDADINAKMLDKWTSLHLAVHSSNLDIIKLLLDRDADINAKTVDDWTSLHLAVHKSDLNITKLLLHGDADINAKTMEGKTPLHIGCNRNNIHVIEILLDAGADVNAADNKGEIPLQIPFRNKNSDIIKLLVNAGADLLRLEDTFNQALLLEAVRYENMDIIGIVLDVYSNENKKINFCTALHAACLQYNTDIIQQLLDAGADINSRDRFGWTLLHLAVEHNHSDVINLLLDKKADINAKTNQGNTPLHWGCRTNNTDVVKKLTDTKADVNATNKEGNTPLHWSCMKNNIEVTKILIDAEADVNATNKQERNCPLHIAVLMQNIQIVDILLSAGADVTLTNKYGVSFMSNRNREITKIYEEFISQTPKEIRRQGSGAIALYHKALRRGTLSSNIIRCMFVGHYGVGKTTLVRALLGKDRRNTESTDGIDINIGNCNYHQDTKQWHVQEEHTENILGIDNIIQIQFWDFAGQRIYYSTHQANLSSRSLYFLVFNMAMGLNGKVGDENPDGSYHLVIDFMEFWVGSIRTYVPCIKPGFPKIVVIGTHCDEVPNVTKIKEEICEKFHPLIQSKMMIVRDEFFVNALEMDEQTTNGIRNAIIEFGTQYPEYGENIPLSWINVQKQFTELKRKGRHIISQDDVKTLTTRNGIFPKELKLFLTFLHDLGYILYYKDDRLKNHVILDPQWVVDALKCIITCKPFRKQFWKNRHWERMRRSGKLDASKLVKVWENKDKDLFFNHKDHLLAVMEKLDLICRPQQYDKKGHDISSEYYFVPCMIAVGTPVELSNIPLTVEESITSDNLLKMTYKFTGILPPAIFPRLICSALSLWPVVDPHLYYDFAILMSGRTHFLIFHKTGRNIEISLTHESSSTDVDIDLCRVVRLFVTQNLNRIISIYNQSIETNECDFYKIEYNAFAITQGFGTARNEVPGKGKECQADCQGLTEVERRKQIDEKTLMIIARVIPPDQLIPLEACLNVHDLDRIQYDFKELGCTVHCLMLLRSWKKQQRSPLVMGQLHASLEDGLVNTHLLCQAIREGDNPMMPEDLHPQFLMLQVTEEILDAVSDHVSLTYIELGLELGLHLDEILRIRSENSTSIIKGVRQMFRLWLNRNKPESKATIACLGRALLNSGCGIEYLQSLEGTIRDQNTGCHIL